MPTATIAYAPAANYSGADSFTYKVSDGSVESGATTVVITVTAVNDVPVAVGESFGTVENMSLVVAAPGVIANDADLDGDVLSAVLVSGPAHGTVTLAADGNFIFAPAANYSGPDNFSYKVNDGTADSNVVTVGINVSEASEPPVALDDAYTVREEDSIQVAAPGVLANDWDGDGDPLTASLVSGPSHGLLVLNTNGFFTYSPEPDFAGTDSFTYQAHADGGVSNLATVTITVTAVNDAPVAVPDSYSTNEDTPLTVAAPGLKANDSDADGSALTAVKVANPAHGTVTVNASGAFIYTPAANYNGPDSFTYRVTDGSANSATVTVTLTVNAVNDAPVAAGQARSVNEDSTRAIVLSGSDADGNPLTFTIVTPPVHGVLIGTAPAVTYDPDPNYNGPDSFTFRANDGLVNSAVGTVTLTVTPVNDAPVGQAASFTTPVNTPKSGVLVATDVDGNPLTYQISTLPTKGTVTVNGATGAFTYTPYKNRVGADSFRFRANDGLVSSSETTISIVIQ